MARKDPSKEALDRVRALEKAAPSDNGVAALRGLLAHQNNHIAGRAAAVAKEWKAEALIPELRAAFDRFLESPVTSDPGCAAKQPIMDALSMLGCADAEFFLSGARYVQREPVYGGGTRYMGPRASDWRDPEPRGSQDTAAGVRGAAAQGLLNMGYPDAYLELANLLRDPDARTRRMAVECLGDSGAYQAELLLRVSALAGDEEPDVVALALQALMRLAPERSLPFVAQFLRTFNLVIAEGAALAIGEARLPESFAILRRALESPGRRSAPVNFLLPIALTRSDDAFDYLLAIVREDREREAMLAIKALAIYAGQEQRVAAVRAAVDARASRDLAQFFNRAFEPQNADD